MKIIRFALLIVGLAFLGIGCRNTAHGAGRDIERMGDKVQDATD
jgi:predicted small secreted protein